MAKSKSALGKKINFVHDAITQKRLGEETSQIGFEKMFKPVTSKLDDVALNLGPLPRAKPARRKKAELEGIDYFPDVDPFEDMDVEGLFDETAPVSPQPEKQISAAVPKGPPPTYEEIMKDSENGPPPEYEEDDPLEDLPPVGETEEANELLTLLSILNYNTVDKALNSSELSATQKRNYLEKTFFPKQSIEEIS